MTESALGLKIRLVPINPPVGIILDENKPKIRNFLRRMQVAKKYQESVKSLLSESFKMFDENYKGFSDDFDTLIINYYSTKDKIEMNYLYIQNDELRDAIKSTIDRHSKPHGYIF